MDVELVTEGASEDENFRVDDNHDYVSFEGERCGICMDIVIDRGVLDCCQHWFCFTCIDNWATITNLCPLCQHEFQLITCVPVYDTIGSNKTDEDSYSRDDDWSIEGKNNSLSFPSYYIDENAVICLDGDGCKIRSGLSAAESDSNLDTSIACDSCDIWYHALCVGFDAEAVCENSWLCPRCTVDQVPQKSDGDPVSRSGNQHCADNVIGDCSVEAAFSGKVSVSVADAGETAVVVSLVEEHQGNEEFGGQHSVLDGEGTKTESSLTSSATVALKSEELASEMTSSELNLESGKLELTLSQNTCFNLPLDSTSRPSLEVKTNEEGTEERKLIDRIGISSAKSSAAAFHHKLLESGLDLHLGLSVSSSTTDDMINDTFENQPGSVHESNLGNLLSANETMPDQEEMASVSRVTVEKEENIAAVLGAKRKHSYNRSDDDGESKAKVGGIHSLKKVKAEGNSQLMHLKDEAIDSVSDDFKNLCDVTTIKDNGSRSVPEKKNVTTDIMDIVKGTASRSLKQCARTNSTIMSAKERENAAGLRVKKIMRRTGDDADSLMQVQKLRKEIREAVRNKSSKDIGENLFDPKLLAAFRAVVAGTGSETKKPAIDMKAKKALLQKGKVRENLTKKIYGMGGKRRRAWTRDCEIEFWKHRCSKMSKPEKLQTLKSVLDLLRNDTDKTVIKHGKKGEATGSILSRLYLADTSVFPRKDDIKPVLALKDVAIPEQNKGHSLPHKSGKISSENEVSMQMVFPPLLSNKLTKNSDSGLKGETASGNLRPDKCTEGPSASKFGGSKSPQQEKIGVSENLKSDKRKWALEVLARKTAVTAKNEIEEKEEDSAMVKGNYPLLAQLPKDMRPVLAPSHHNKVPTAVRQAQLYRLAEFFLRKTNLPLMRRTAETELAVADAINVEREIANRSSSKLVYVNLCAQELLRRSDNTISGCTAETNLSPTSVVRIDGAEVTTDSISDPDVNEALKNAGLLSDTPPNSPYQPVEEIKDTGILKNIEDDGPESIFDMDSQSELDIYGDFEYNLEDDDFIGGSALKISKLQQEESKMKVVFFTVSADKSNGHPDIPYHESSMSVEASQSSSGQQECPKGSGISNVDNSTNDSLPQISALNEECEEPSLAECEELYGPDKEPLIDKYPEIALMKPYEVIAAKGNENVIDTHQCPSVSENSPIQQQKTEDVQRKENNSSAKTNRQSDCSSSVSKRVEVYIKEHIRPLCKSGVITVEQYRWAVAKTTEKVMKYHSKDKNANFLIKEGEKVKKLAEQYIEAAPQTLKS